MRTIINVCPLARRYIFFIMQFLRKLNVSTCVTAITSVIIAIACSGSNWISVCAPLETSSKAFELYHAEFKIPHQMQDSTHELCLSIGLVNGVLSLPHAKDEFMYLGDRYHPVIIFTYSLLMLASGLMAFLVISNIVAVLIPMQICHGIIKDKIGLVILAIAFLFISCAMVSFTIYIERRVIADPMNDVIKHMLNNFNASYGFLYFLTWLGLLSNGLAIFFQWKLYQQNLTLTKEFSF